MTDAELIARLRDVDKVTIGDARVAADRIEDAEKELRKSALQELSALGQASEAYQAQLAAEAKLALMMTERDEAWKRAAHAEKMWGEAEVKLAKALEALQNVTGEYDLFRKYEYERGLAPLDDEIHNARATIAAVSETHKIKGESRE